MNVGSGVEPRGSMPVPRAAGFGAFPPLDAAKTNGEIAPYLPFAILVGIGSVEWIYAIWSAHSCSGRAPRRPRTRRIDTFFRTARQRTPRKRECEYNGAREFARRFRRR
jgi:hypothetical protein